MNIRRRSSGSFETFRFLLILSLTLTEQVEAGFKGAWNRHNYTPGKYMQGKIQEETKAHWEISEIWREMGRVLKKTERKIEEPNPVGMPRFSNLMPMVREVNMEERKNRSKANDKRFMRVFKKSSMFSK